MYINRNRTQLKRVLIVNKFYYRRGGDCTYMLNLERMLQDRGHDTAVFAMQYPENIASTSVANSATSLRLWAAYSAWTM